ncbi:MAG TPA: hypothetical protein DCQ31_13385 [Bacteroidales bacterium]|nr:hypothetical protein [Bacteroidales bacterium]
MKINYSAELQQFEITDNAQAKAFINGVLLIIFSLIGAVHAADIWLNGANYSNLAMFGAGLVSLAVLTVAGFKITNKSTLKFTEIESFNQTVLLNGKIFYFKLKNKRIRSLDELKGSDNVNNTIELMKLHGIAFNKVASPLRFLKYRKVVKNIISNEN